MIRLRNARLEDLAYICELEARFAALGFVGCDDEAIHKQRLENADSAYFVVEHNEAPAGFVILCGLCGIHRNVLLRRVVVAEPGQGMGREALRLVLRHVFAELSAHRFWLDVYDDNERALRAYRALGFVEEGTMRECIWSGGRFRSLIVMSILDREFE